MKKLHTKAHNYNNQEIFIQNKSLYLYLKSKDWIILKYRGTNIKILINTVFLGFSLKHYLDDSWKIGIDCHADYKDWIPEPLEYKNSEERQNSFSATYEIHHIELNNDDHIQIAKNLGIPIPLIGTDKIKDYSNKEVKKKYLLCVNGPSQYSLSYQLESDLVSLLGDVTVGQSIGYNHTNYWTNDYIKPKSLLEMIDLISEHEYVIATDNDWLTLANAFPNKKVVGIFGPTYPQSSLKINSMKIIQLVDDKQFIKKHESKNCPCINPVFCHRGYEPKSSPFCFNISARDLLNRINNLW